MMTYNSIFKTTLGKDVEDAMCRCSVRQIKKHNCNVTKFTKTTGTKTDLFEGTDAIWGGVRIDFTYNYSNKDNTRTFMRCKPLNVNGFDITIKCGIRTGNSYKGFTKFSKPVLVIGFDCDDNNWLDNNFNDVFNAIEPKLYKILAHARNNFIKLTANA